MGGTWASREGTLASREGSLESRGSRTASREATLASREGSLSSQGSVRSGASNRVAKWRGSSMVAPLGAFDITSGDATLRFGTPLPPIRRDFVPRYLERFGYITSDLDQWLKPTTCNIWPTLSLTTRRQFNMLEHTWYCVHVSLSIFGSDSDLESGKRTAWTVPRRLCHFQDGLLKYVKALPTAVFKEHFRGTPFAHRGGIPGTAEKLKGWCAALAAFINSGRAAPLFVALCLRWAEHPTEAVWERTVPHQDMIVDDRPVEVYQHHEADKDVVVDGRLREISLQHSEPPQVATGDIKASEANADIEPLQKSEEDDILRVVTLAQTTQSTTNIDV